jgi:hypothetical protein
MISPFRERSSISVPLLPLYKFRTPASLYFLHLFFPASQNHLLNTWYYVNRPIIAGLVKKVSVPCSKKTGRTPGDPF